MIFLNSVLTLGPNGQGILIAKVANETVWMVGGRLIARDILWLKRSWKFGQNFPQRAFRFTSCSRRPCSFEAKHKPESKLDAIFSPSYAPSKDLKKITLQCLLILSSKTSQILPHAPLVLPGISKNLLKALNTSYPERFAAPCLKCWELSSGSTGLGFQRTVGRIDTHYRR